MRTIKIFILILITGFFFHSCDIIEDPYVITVGGGTDTTECPLPEFPVNQNPVKRVLLEDYTGHTCVNCAAAGLLAHDLEETYGDRLVTIAVHAGWFAQPAGDEFPADYRTEAGNEWDNFFGIGAVGNPNGMVDRTGYNTDYILSLGAWSGRIGDQMDIDPQLDIQIINDYDELTRKVCTHIQTVFLDQTEGNLKLCVVLTEDHIISPQKNNNPEAGDIPVIENYEHMNMLRGAINGAWGVNLALAGVQVPAGTEVIKSYKIILGLENVAENCNVVAFIYDGDTYEVIQAMKMPIIP